jgi:ATP-dependent DNA ligase
MYDSTNLAWKDDRLRLRSGRTLATKRPPAGDGWLHEIKHDGFRIMARRVDRQSKTLLNTG